MTTQTDEMECVDRRLRTSFEDRDETDCQGEVAYHSTDPGVRPAFPRCERHWLARVEADQEHRTIYPDSPIAPAWFDPAAAGERWDEE